jgi:thiol-disulfide isomerase/thioredoxin
MRLNHVLGLSIAIFLLPIARSGGADKNDNQGNDTKPYLTVRLVDEQKKPLPGTQAGIWVITSDIGDETGDWNFRYGGVADRKGILRFRDGADVFQTRPVIIARHAERRLVGVQSFVGKELSGITDITLRPECRVQWRFASSQLKAAGHDLGRLSVRVTFDGMICFFSLIQDPTFHTVLPPGKFALECHGKNVTSVSKEIEIKVGQKSLDLGVSDLAAVPYVLLEGKPAPELDDVIEWKNGPALKLADLRGKVVLLDFWGWWCGSCVERGIPDLFKIEADFQGADLVIIGIHTPRDELDEVDTVAKLDDKLAQVREKIWGGRDINFPVAVSRMKIGSYSTGGEEVARSKICFDYGVEGFPTTVLIGRDGKVVGRFEAGSEDDRAKLKKLVDKM